MARPPIVTSPQDAGEAVDSGSPRFTRLPELFFALVTLLLVAIAIAEARRGFMQSPGTDWNTSEWMIDFAAGFMRRGLGGAALQRLLLATGWSFFAVLTTLTTTAYLGLCAFAVVKSWRSRAPALWRLFLLFNPLLLIAAAEFGSFARKDVVFLCGTLVHAGICQWILQQNRLKPDNRARLALLELTTVLIASGVLAALHEGLFLFIWLPANAALAAYVIRQLYPGRRATLLALAAAFAPSLAIVFASVQHHGGPGAAQIICQSWRFAMPVNCTPGPQFPKAIDALAWSMQRDVLGCFNFVWTAGNFYLVIFFAQAALAIGLLLAAVLVLEPAAKLEHLLAIAACSFLFSLPLFVLGTDWGRWLFMAGTTSLILMLSEPLRPALYGVLPAPARRLFDRARRPADARLRALQNFVGRYPGFCLTLMIMLPLPPLPIASAILLANPLMIFINFLARLHG